MEAALFGGPLRPPPVCSATGGGAPSRRKPRLRAAPRPPPTLCKHMDAWSTTSGGAGAGADDDAGALAQSSGGRAGGGPGESDVAAMACCDALHHGPRAAHGVHCLRHPDVTRNFVSNAGKPLCGKPALTRRPQRAGPYRARSVIHKFIYGKPRRAGDALPRRNALPESQFLPRALADCLGQRRPQPPAHQRVPQHMQLARCLV